MRFVVVGFFSRSSKIEKKFFEILLKWTANNQINNKTKTNLPLWSPSTFNKVSKHFSPHSMAPRLKLPPLGPQVTKKLNTEEMKPKEMLGQSFACWRLHFDGIEFFSVGLRGRALTNGTRPRYHRFPVLGIFLFSGLISFLYQWRRTVWILFPLITLHLII